MLVFSAFTPNSPLLHPLIGGEHLDSMQETDRALTRLAEELYASHPDTVMHVSLDGDSYADAVRVNHAQEYRVDLVDFGREQVPGRYLPDSGLISALQSHFRASGMPISLDSEESLRYNTAIPLMRLFHGLESRIVPIHVSGSDMESQLVLGRALKDIASHSSKRIAIIASGDLAHTGAGAHFDHAARHAIYENDPQHLLSLEESHLEDQYGLEALLAFLGTHEEHQVRPEILSYENPFGVGYLVAQFHHA